MECLRCGFTTDRRDTLLKHFNRKTACEPIKEDIPVSILEKEFRVRSKRSKNTETGLFECSKCGKEYKSSNGKYKHMKTCSKPTENTPQQADLLSQALSRIAELETQMSEMHAHGFTDNRVQINGDQNITNVYNINIRPFGQENIDYLIEGDNCPLKQVLTDGKQIFQKMVKAIHFNEEHPENMNVYISNLRGKHAYVFDGERFKVMLKKETVEHLVSKTKNVIAENYETVGLDDVSLKRTMTRLDMLDCEPEVLETLQNKVELMCYNEKNMIEPLFDKTK
jgi:hypothetical protein